jgi:amidase
VGSSRQAPAASERHDIHVRSGSTRPIPTRPTDSIERNRRAENQAAKAYSWALSPQRHTRLEDFHVGVVLDHEHAPVSSEFTAPLSNAVDALARAGARVVEGWPDGVDPVQHYESFGFHVQSFFAFQKLGEDFAKFSEFVDYENRRMAARADWNRYFNDIDVFLCPVNFTPAFPHDTRPFEQRTITTPEGERPYNDQAFWVSHTSLAGLPAVAAPIGRTPGRLPSVHRLWVRSTKTTRRSHLPNCSEA